MSITVTVEDGSGAAGANSYQSIASWKLYADAHGYSYAGKTDDQIASALIRSAAWIDNNYRARWLGVRTYGNSQMLLWPRKQGIYVTGVFVQNGPLTTIADTEGVIIATDAIPSALIAAQAEAAWRELVDPGSLAPDLDRGGAIKRLQAGSVAVEYATTAPVTTTFAVIDNLLSALLVSGNGYTAKAVRA